MTSSLDRHAQSLPTADIGGSARAHDGRRDVAMRSIVKPCTRGLLRADSRKNIIGIDTRRRCDSSRRPTGSAVGISTRVEGVQRTTATTTLLPPPVQSAASSDSNSYHCALEIAVIQLEGSGHHVLVGYLSTSPA